MLYGIWEAVRTFFSNEFDECRPPFRIFVTKIGKNMMKEKLVFVTNDDGYNSRGIQALLEVARKFGRVVAIAPETPQSGMSQAITINNPLFLREVSKGDGVEVYAFSGTPVD